MILPEVLFEYVIKDGLKSAREDRTYVQQLFKNSPKNLVDEFYDALQAHKIIFTMEFPQEQLEVPIIWLNLISEDEEEAFLGEMMGFGHGGDGVTLTDGYTYPYVGKPASMFFDSSQGTSEPTVPGGADPYPGEAFAASGGVLPTDVANPVARPIHGEPSRIFDVAPNAFGRVPLYEQIGQGYRAAYALTIMGPGSTYVLFLYALVKSILNRHRPFLEQNGVFNLSMSGTDFMGDPEMLPMHVYARAVELSFLYFFGDIQTIDDAAKGIEMYVEALEQGSNEVLEVIPILGDAEPAITSITPNTGAQGSTVTVTASGTGFHNGCTIEMSGEDIELKNAAYIAGNSLRFDVEIGASASLGSRDVTIRNPNGMFDTLESGFTITT